MRELRPTVVLVVWLLVVLGAAARLVEASPEIPGAPQSEPIAVVGGTVYPVSGEVLQKATVLFDEGRIVAVGTDVTIPEGAKQIDATGKHVYPGLIDAHTQLGLVEIASVRATRDTIETGDLNPNSRALVAVNPDSELTPVARAGGVLTVLTVPLGGLLSGKSALVNLDGWTYEEMAVVGEVALHVAWPRMSPQRAWWISDSSRRQIEQRDKKLAELRQAFADARAYRIAVSAKGASSDGEINKDQRWEAMLPVLSGEQPIIVAADDAEQIEAAVAFALREGKADHFRGLRCTAVCRFAQAA